ncbi:MAG: hypothetical protein AAGK02_13500 [Pseudomonadota bacterium]
MKLIPQRGVTFCGLKPKQKLSPSFTTSKAIIAKERGEDKPNEHETRVMELFRSDLYRNFGIGFVVGALLVGAMTMNSWDGDIAPSAQAAEQVQPTSEFVIEEDQ